MSEPRSDSVMPDESEDAARAHLERLFARIGQQSDRYDAIEVDPESSLAAERQAVPRQPTQYRLQNCIAAAFDHLRTLHVVLQDGLPMMGAYPIIRAAIEVCALGIWAIDPGTRNARIFRALQMGWLEYLKTADVAKKLRNPPIDLERAWARHNEIKDQRPALRQKSLANEGPSMTSMLMHVETRVPGRTAYGPLVAWSVCSSLAHGNQVMQHNVLERRYLGDEDGTGAMWHTTSSFTLVALLLDATVELLTYLIDQYEEHAKPESKRRRADKDA